ncbi:MAG: sel1 repeat family protein [Parachlamydiales bacterium]|nr:sel1 repeat family protein [Parachlamydiales bacterium]
MLVLIAEEDWNGALDVDLKGHCLASFASKYDITIEKLNESWDIAYYIEKFAQKKGKKFPVFVMAHGSEHAMHFGKGIEGQYHDQLVSAGEFKGAKELILWSCSTGAKGGIGEKIALTHPGLVVFAPKKPPSYLEDYSKRTNEMDVEFYDLYEGIGRRICFFKEPRELIELLSTSPKNSLSLLFIGQMYKFGIGIKKNRKLGKNLIKQSQAIVKYSDLEKGQLDVYHNLQSDGKKTELILKEMYKTRGDLAYYQLGRMHFEQGGYEDGFICFQKAANNGDRKAQKALSWMYSRGIGVGRDHKKARYWLQQSKNKTHS